jgi:hypothetical protein
MTPDLIFTLVNVIAVAGWVMLAAVPRLAAHVVAAIAIPTLLSLFYTAIVATTWYGSAGGFTSLSDVATLFGNRWLLLAGWMHYLAFDLFVGGWEVRDARVRGIPHLLVLPCLVLTFLFGPAGWFLYLVLRAVYRAAPAGA